MKQKISSPILAEIFYRIDFSRMPEDFFG